MVRSPLPMARLAPFGEATRPDHSTPGIDRTYSAICSASAIAGTARGETNAVASIRRTPVATRAWISRILSSVLIGVSICRPSRGPTSRMSTRVGKSVIVVLLA